MGQGYVDGFLGVGGLSHRDDGRGLGMVSGFCQ